MVQTRMEQFWELCFLIWVLGTSMSEFGAMGCYLVLFGTYPNFCEYFFSIELLKFPLQYFDVIIEFFINCFLSWDRSVKQMFSFNGLLAEANITLDKRSYLYFSWVNAHYKYLKIYLPQFFLNSLQIKLLKLPERVNNDVKIIKESQFWQLGFNYAYIAKTIRKQSIKYVT